MEVPLSLAWCAWCGVGAHGTGGVRAGCTFADFDGYRTLLAGFDARVSLVQCTFAGNTLFPEDFGAAVIEAEAFFGSSQVTLEGCTISNNTPSTLPTLLADNREADVRNEAVFYSDSSSPSVCMYEGDDTSSTPPCVDSSPLALDEAGADFLTPTDAWFVEVQQVRPSCASLRKALVVAHPAPPAFTPL